MTKNFIEISKQKSELTFNFGNMTEKFVLNFQRTLRIPDDNKKYSLPPSIGQFPLEHVEDYSKNLTESWSEYGGIFMPMYQSEAMWMSFKTQSGRPFAVKVASGKINAVSGKTWSNELEGNVKFENELKARLMEKYNKQEADYMVSPKQPWLDGFNVGKGVIRQFVAVPLDSGYTVEEQVTGKAEHGGIQIIVYPMKDSVWNKIKAEQEKRRNRIVASGADCFAMAASASYSDELCAPMGGAMLSLSAKPDMGLGAGGMMTQEIYDDEYGVDVWDQENGLRVFVHLANSEQYKMITGINPPTTPPTANTYRQYGYQWFDYYSDGEVLKGSDILSKVDSIASMQNKKNEKILPDDGHKPGINQPVIHLGKKTVSSGNW
jgi:hypothetical protein